MGRSDSRFLTPGVIRRVEYMPARAESAVAIIMQGGRTAWRLRIFCEGEPNDGNRKTGSIYLGAVRTLPWAGQNRVVAIACCPGAGAWYVDGRPEDRAETEVIDIDFMGQPCCGTWGVHAIPGASLPRARHLVTLSGVAGAVTVPGPVVGWSAIAGLLGAVVSVSMPGDPVPVPISLPAGAAYHDHYDGSSGDIVTLNFAGTLTYSITYELGGDGVDNV